MSTKVLLYIICITLLSASAFAVDGVVLINQASVMAAGGFPYTISKQGSYRLASNLLVPAGVDGIDIRVDGVTLDLNGFSIIGPVTCTGRGSSLTCTPATIGDGISSSNDDITIRNGTVQGMAGTGILLLVGSSGNLVEDVKTKFNGSVGIEVAGAIVRRCTAVLNQSLGIELSDGIAESNYATANGVTGISAAFATVIGNTSTNNGNFALGIVDGVFGSNLLFASGPFGPLIEGDGNVSQFNNNCNGVPC